MKRARTASVVTHRRPQETAGVLGDLLGAAERSGVALCFSERETEKHGLRAGPNVRVDCPEEEADEVDLCVVLGGDGSILSALRRYAGTSVPVFGVNFGELGFLATVDPAEAGEGFRRAFAGDYETLSLPAITGAPVGDGTTAFAAVNDVSLHRRAGGRVAQLEYAVSGQDVGSVRCDGIVVATPAGSTGYNLANGGPVLAWGVKGLVVSFIAPHSLTARALVVAPDDVLSVRNRSREESVDISADGRPSGELAPGEAVSLSFSDGRSVLAQLPGTNFYTRLHEKFGRLAR